MGLGITQATKVTNVLLSQKDKICFMDLKLFKAADQHMLDLPHTIYLELFKHMIDWIQRFLKNGSGEQAFDNAWKALRPYKGFIVPEKACRTVTQYQGKEMRNLGWCLLGVLAIALRQRDSRQVQHFKGAFTCVRSPLNFRIMAQYRSHTDHRIEYMESYENRFHERKVIFFELRISKQTQVKADTLPKELPRGPTLVNQSVVRLKRPQVSEQDHGEENDQRIDSIYTESRFKFNKMYLMSHFRHQINQFGNILMYSTEYGELAHKEQINDGYQCSNKIDVARQILSS